MAKRSKKNNTASQHVSPLNSSVVADGEREAEDNNGDAPEVQSNRHRGSSTNNNRRGGLMSESKLSEEAALTEILFGTGDGGGGQYTREAASSAAWFDDDVDAVVDHGNQRDGELYAIDRSGEDGELFAIDRSGEEVEDHDGVEEEEDADFDIDRDEHQIKLSYDHQNEDSDDESNASEEYNEQGKATMKGAAWQDSEEEEDSSSDDSDNESIDDDRMPRKKKGVSLVDGPNRLKKLRRYRDETNPLSFKEYELRLRERFVNTASVAARTDWADVSLAQNQQQGEEEAGGPHKKKKRKGYASSTEDESSDEEHGSAAKDILASNASLFATSTSGLPLPPTLLNIVRSRDGNLSDPNNSVVNACQFHPGSSDEDNPLLMTAGMDKMLRFFRVDGEDNTKIHGIHFPKMPITCASFLGDSGSVVLSGRRPFFYVYDAISGNIQRIPSIVGRKERSLEKFVVSPDGRIIAFVGNDGYVILVDGKTRQWIGDLKMNGSVRAITFTGDGEFVIGSGSDGDVYRWHIGSRRCVERFHNQDGTITSSLAISSNFLAVGAESGVVNLYNDKHSSTAPGRGLSLTASERTPLKSIMNLATSADNMCFNHDGQILAMSTRRETNGLKLLHVPTRTVFSNWPTSKTPLKYVWSMDFSPGSKYLAVGNDHGKCLLYRLKHYWDE